MTTTPRITPPNAMPIARNVAQRVDRRYPSSLCTAPVINSAGALLDAWCVTAADRGIDMAWASGGGEWAEQLAVVALDMVTRQVREPRPRTPAEATALLDAVVARLAERGITTDRDILSVPLPRTRNTPAWGRFESSPLAISVNIERGWELAIEQSAGSPVVQLIARCDESGIDPVLDLAEIINDGNYGNIFGS